MTSFDINWQAQFGETVVKTPDFHLKVADLEYDGPVKGHRGYRLTYRPNGVVVAEGVDIVVAVRRTLAEQEVLNVVKANPMRGIVDQDSPDEFEGLTRQ